MISEKELELLIGAGLNSSQAKVYLSLFMTGPSSIKAIAETSKMDASNAHKTILALEKFCLVNKTIARPNIYEAINIKDAFEILLNRKTQEVKNLSIQTKKIVEHYNKIHLGNHFHPIDKPNLFLLVPPEKQYVNMIKKNYDNAHESIDLVTTFKRSMESYDPEGERKTLARGVKIRVLMYKPFEGTKLLRSPQFTKRPHPNFEQRFLEDAPKVVGGIFDNKIASFVVKPDASFNNSPCLITNNQGLISIFRYYFDNLWNATKTE